MTTYTGRKREPNTLVFGNQMVVDQGVNAMLELTKQFLKGTVKAVPNDPATPKTEVTLECLNSVAPEPLNWKMWCPGTDAKVYGWQDKSGAAHRQITLRPQPGMTSTMYQWFITSHVLGLMPPVVEFQGNHYYYYHLWHPLDHVEAAWALGPKVPFVQKGMPIYTLIHERYRNVPGFPYDRHYETNGWFYVDDAVTNLMKNRYVITMPLMGMPTWTMILEFNDTPEGLVVDIEVVAGIPYKGYDERSPTDGYMMAAGLNEMMTAPLVARQKGSFDWEESINAITRHAIEEFSNLQHFVPYLYEKYTILGHAGINWVPTLGTWMQYNKWSVNDGSSISFYHMLAAMAKMQIPINSTHHTDLVNAAVDKMNQTWLHATHAAEALNVGKAQATYVPKSNAVTKYAYDKNRANGAHPDQDVTLRAMLKNFTSMFNVSVSLDATQKVHSVLAATGANINVAHASDSSSNSTGHGFMHKLGKGLTGAVASVTVQNVTHLG